MSSAANDRTENLERDSLDLDEAQDSYRDGSAAHTAPQSYYFGSGTRRHEASHMTENWVTMWCGIGGRTSGPAIKVRSSRVEPNCRACANSKARFLNRG